MLRVVTFTLALMAIGATADTLDGLKTAGCVDQSADFIEKLPGPLTDCAQVASTGSCTHTDASPEQNPGDAFRLRRACPEACNSPCLDSPAPLAADQVGMTTGAHNSWTCTQYADWMKITDGDCSLATTQPDPAVSLSQTSPSFGGVML